MDNLEVEEESSFEELRKFANVNIATKLIERGTIHQEITA